MKREAINISLQSLAVGPGTAYWLNMEQMQEMTDAVTFEQAAEFIDALYDIDPCVPIENEAGGDPAEEDSEGNPVAPVEEEEFVSLAQQMLERAALCGTLDGSYECVIRVARSHQNEPYKLAINNGEELQRTTEQGRASQTLIVEGEASASLKLPVLGNLAYEWQGPVYDLSGVCPGPAIELLGSTLNFGKRITGTVTAHFDTQYDLVTLKIDGNEEGEPQPAMVLAFYAGLVAEQQIEPPEVSEEDEATKRTLCDQAGADLNPTPDAVECYEIVDSVTRCRCSGNIIAEKTTTAEHSVTCPDGLDCPGGESECRKLMGSRQVTVGYARCPDEEYKEGDVGDPDFYLQTCCEVWTYKKYPGPLPACRTMTGLFRGGRGVSDEDKALYPGALFIGIGPADGVCGKTVTTWTVASRNCCDDAEPLAWDGSKSISVIGKNSSGMVFVLGGAIGAVRTWTVRGQGVFTDYAHSRKSGETNGNALWIYTDNTACGTFTVDVTDGCSTAYGYVRCTAGQWIMVCSSYAECQAYGCPGTIVEVSRNIITQSSAQFFAITDNAYMIEEIVQCPGWFHGQSRNCGYDYDPEWPDCACNRYYFPYFPGTDWPPCIDEAKDWLETESFTLCNESLDCAPSAPRNCVVCDDLGGMFKRRGIINFDDGYMKKVTRQRIYEWVC